jgi:hypothetical protein
MKSNFIADCVNGIAKTSNINKYIEEYHEIGRGEIWDYLGMSWGEYATWLENDNYLDTIVSNRKNHM